MAGHGEKFGRKKEEAIVALPSQTSVKQAAHVAGVGTRTLVRWMQMPEFKAAASSLALSPTNVKVNLHRG